MSKIKLAVFDLAGTTVKDDNAVARCLVDALGAAGVEVTTAEANGVMGIRKPVAIGMLLKAKGAEGDAEAIDADFKERMLSFYRTDPSFGEIDGVSALFRSLKEKGIRVAVDTGFDRETTSVLLERVHWGELLDDSITSDEVAHGRPQPDMILELARRCGASVKETIKIGDTPSDVKQGQAAGVALTVGVAYGSHSREVLEALAPDFVVDQPSEILEIIEKFESES